MNKVWIWAENHNGKLLSQISELFHGARYHLKAKTVEAVLIGNHDQDLLNEIFSYGADTILTVKDPNLELFHEEQYITILKELVKKHQPSVILFANTINGQSLASWLAAKLDVSFGGLSHSISLNSGSIEQKRLIWSGHVITTNRIESHPQILLMQAKSFPAMDKQSCIGQILEESYNKLISNPLKTELLKIVKSTVQSISLESADIIVSGGKGLGNPDGFKLVYELAHVLGASVGATRAVVDAGWISYDHQIGQTGKNVSPKLYIACGISGAVQHLSGMKMSDIIIAINSDSDAPIFQIATYGIIGNVHEILPLMTEMLKSVLKKGC